MHLPAQQAKSAVDVGGEGIEEGVDDAGIVHGRVAFLSSPKKWSRRRRQAAWQAASLLASAPSERQRSNSPIDRAPSAIATGAGGRCPAAIMLAITTAISTAIAASVPQP